MRRKILGILLGLALTALPAQAATDGSLGGTISDKDGVALSGAQVQLLDGRGKVLKETHSSTTGAYQFFPLAFGDYEVSVRAPGNLRFDSLVHVSSGAASQLDAQLLPAPTDGKEMVVEVKAKKHLLHNSSSVSSNELTSKNIEQLPQGNDVSLPKLITSTTPGAVSGPFGQVFFRGNHANIQYQIDGVQIPDSPSNTFGQAFSPRNIDRMEVITGGVPAEFGERLAAVVNITTKSGPEKPGGEAEVNYGSYNTFAPYVTYGGSNAEGNVHYYLSAGYNRTDRGLDTPQPTSESDQSQGGKDTTHDRANGHNEFAKIDWQVNNENKLSFIAFDAQNHYEIPNFPSSFSASDPYFQPGFADSFGNGGNAAQPTFTYTPAATNDWETQEDTYAQVVWKHSLSDRSYFQLAPYYKYSSSVVHNDPTNDLYTAAGGTAPVAGSNAASLAENRHVNNLGLKGDYSFRADDQNLIKAGFQGQYSKAEGLLSVQTNLNTAPSTDSKPDSGGFESVYVQDDYTISKQWTLNAGLRYDISQFSSDNLSSSYDLFQPRLGINYLPWDHTKFHAFYGKLFQPAPIENLRDTFASTGGDQVTPYDIKPEKDNYFEVGVNQQVGENHSVGLTAYYKLATDMLDDQQLYNTSIAQPYNLAKGFAKGLELSWKGQIDSDWFDYANYTYEIAKGKGISGGLFAFPVGQDTGGGYQYLDHVQVHTANAGLGYGHKHFSASLEGLFGSGLRTGPDNSLHLPSHFTMDFTVGYEFRGDDFWTKWKVSVDALNLFDNAYPITVANGYNGSHYAAGREFFLRLSKEL